MRILLVNQYYPPDTSATAVILADLVHELAHRGHEVSVLCGRPSYMPASPEPLRARSGGVGGRIRIVRVGSFAFHRRRMLGRALNYLSFLFLACFRGVLVNRPDAVIAATDPPMSIWPALLAARGKPVVYSLRDLHPDAAIAAGFVRPRMLTRMWDSLHSWAMRRASMVVCLGEGMAELVRAKGVPRSRIAIIEDGAWAPVSEPRESVVLQLRREAPFVAMYAGNIGSAFRWETLSEADALLEDAEIILVGEGSQVPSIEGKVRIEPFRPLDELASVMAAGDLQIVPLRKEMSGQIVPSKLFTVLSHGRPVLAAVAADSEVARVIQEWGCGVLVDPDRPDEIASEITRLSRSPDSVQAMASRAKEAGEHYERGRLLREFATLVESFASTSDRNER